MSDHKTNRFAGILSAHNPMKGKLSREAISTVELNKPVSAKLLENIKINIGKSASPRPQPTHLIARTQANTRTPYGNDELDLRSDFGLCLRCIIQNILS